ncbi:UNVERIFIED_CONTAM: hypothetical protein NCL1_53992 [Trichonephila clavipes]
MINHCFAGLETEHQNTWMMNGLRKNIFSW